MSLAGSPAISANIVWGRHLMPAIYSWPHCRRVIHSPLLGSNWWPLQPGSHHGTMKGVGHEVAWTAAALCEGGNRAGTWWRWLRAPVPLGCTSGLCQVLDAFCGDLSIKNTTARMLPRSGFVQRSRPLARSCRLSMIAGMRAKRRHGGATPCPSGNFALGVLGVVVGQLLFALARASCFYPPSGHFLHVHITSG